MDFNSHSVAIVFHHCLFAASFWVLVFRIKLRTK